jgi:hypothetical protein
MRIIISFDVTDKQRRAMAKDRYGKDRPLTAKEIKSWASSLIETAIEDMLYNYETRIEGETNDE